MGTHMKTTIEIADALLRDAKQLARSRNTTLRELFETALRRELAAARAQPRRRFKLRNVSVKGKGVQPGIDVSNWGQIRSLIYEGRGG
jgi:hypothetical protein